MIFLCKKCGSVTDINGRLFLFKPRFGKYIKVSECKKCVR